MNVGEAKQLAARAALELLPESGIVGLGSGSTAAMFIDEVAALVRAGRALTGVPTSVTSRRQAEAGGIPLLGDDGPWDIALCVDGADEVSAELDLVKGGGAAHTREKIVNASSRVNVIIVDESKLSRRLGEKWPVPVEVLPFGRGATQALLTALGRPEVRTVEGAPRLTDAGNFVVDLHTGPIDDPARLDRAIRDIPGVVETGLFVQRADVVIVAGASGVRQMRRSE